MRARRKKYDLNSISHDACISLVQSLRTDGVDVHEVFVDTVGDPDKYRKKLELRFPSVLFTVSKKAGELFH